MSYPIHNDAELLAYLKANLATIPFDAEIIASTTVGFLVCDRRYPAQVELQSDSTLSGAMAKFTAAIPTPAARAEELRAKAAKMLAEAAAIAPLTGQPTA